MATNSVTWTGLYGQYSRLYIELTLASQNVGNNTSTFAYKVRGQSTDVNASIWWDGGSLQLSNAYSKTKALGSGSFNYSTEFVFDSGTFTVSHNADGTLSARTLTAYVTLSSGHNATVSVSLSVPTIPRASQPSLNVSTQALGSSITISTNRASTSFTHTLTYAFGNQSGTIATGVTTSQAWTLPIGLASAIPNSLSGVGTITCQTFNGSTSIGSKSVSFTATVPNNATFQPSATINSIVEGDTLPSGITVFVQNQSKAKVTSSGTGKYNSTINTYSVAVAGIGTYSGSVITSDFLRNSGTVRITLTVTDSRGLKGSTFQDINVVAYSPPQLPTFNAQRSESTPENILANFNASISNLDNQNNKLFRIRSKASDGGWNVETSATEMYTFSGTETIFSDPDKSYTIEFFIQDSFTSVTQTVQVGTAFTLIDFNASGKGMAIGKVSESDTFEVAIPTFLQDFVHYGDQEVKAYNNKDTMSTVVEIDNFYDSLSDGIADNRHYTAYCSLYVAHPALGGGRHYIEGHKATNDYEYQTSTTYAGEGIRSFLRSKMGGVWGPWIYNWHSGNSNSMTGEGSNSNGRYIRFSDGTQICWHTMSITASFTADGALFSIPEIGWSFPSSFTVVPFANSTISNYNNTFQGTTYTGTTVNSHTFKFFRNFSTGSVTFSVNCFAIGRWK